MPEKERKYIAIDLKSFYASVECVERNLDPLDTCLVVADESRTSKTICLAVSPSLKAYGTGGRPRLFEVEQKIKEVNSLRGREKKSFSAKELNHDYTFAVDYIIALPRMSLYIDYSRRIYEIYLKFIAPEDIHVYSIDEVFMDVTSYLETYHTTPHELAITIIREVLKETGITATAGIGTNLYLAKIAMDIVAKKMKADKDGVRIAELDEMTYRKTLWDHTPLTDFWRVGRGIASRLYTFGMETMGDIARCSLENEELLFNLFGVNAELLIDHAWGWEPVTIEEVKAYKPESKSINSGQVLQNPYNTDEARTVVLEMADAISFDLLDKGYLTDQIVLTVGYDVESLTNPEIAGKYHGVIKRDYFGRNVPKHAHGTINFERPTCSAKLIIEKTGELYDRIINRSLLVRRISISVNHLIEEKSFRNRPVIIEADLFTDYEEVKKTLAETRQKERKDYNRQKALLKIKKKFGNNAILRGLNFADGATQINRNSQIGGHRK